jgi:hypothetical protein
VHNERELEHVLTHGKPGTRVEAYLTPELPLRGTADAAFAQRVLDLCRETIEVPQRLIDGRVIQPPFEFLLLAAIQPGQLVLETAEADTRADVTDWLQAHRGQQAAVGLSPEEPPKLLPRAAAKRAILAVR